MVPATGFVKFTAVVVALLQSVWSVMLSTVGVGFTVMVNELVGPVQPLAVGVTVMVEVTGAVPPLVAVKAAMLPLPLAKRPMEASSFVQAYVVPPTAPLKFTAVVVALLHKV